MIISKLSCLSLSRVINRYLDRIDLIQDVEERKEEEKGKKIEQSMHMTRQMLPIPRYR